MIKKNEHCQLRLTVLLFLPQREHHEDDGSGPRPNSGFDEMLGFAGLARSVQAGCCNGVIILDRCPRYTNRSDHRALIVCDR